MSAPSHSPADFPTQIKSHPYWLDTVEPLELPRLNDSAQFDLLIIGGGFTGLWCALLAKAEYPDLRIGLCEAAYIGYGGSGRNGGFLHASLTHGYLNGISRWPTEYNLLRELGEANLHAIRDFVQKHKIECDWRDAGEVEVATEEYQVIALGATARTANAYGEEFIFETADQVRQRLNSPRFQAANFEPHTVAMVNPAQLAQGLAKVAVKNGVEIFENSPAKKISRSRNRFEVEVNNTQVTATKIALATNAFRSPIAAVRRRIVPVFDYQVATEIIPEHKWAELGWDGFEGFRDAGNQFHYFRRTADNRILFGGYDAVYYYKNRNDLRTEHNELTYNRLREHFFDFFPQLVGTRFEYKWGGAIDTCTRFTAFWGTKHQQNLAYVAGYTGLGVGASRFGAQVLLDLLYKPDSALLKLKMVRTKPLPFPPEPLRWLVIKITQVSLARADKKQGRRNLWLRLLDLLGLGFDS